jgi:hypothetical protein
MKKEGEKGEKGVSRIERGSLQLWQCAAFQHGTVASRERRDLRLFPLRLSENR